MSRSIGLQLPEHLQARQAARRRESGVLIGAGLVALLCMIGAAVLLPSINGLRKEKQLVIDPESVRGLPPDIALLGKLGTFRALAIDWASIRADRLKEEGKTYEALQLHETICRLAPRFPTVWANAAWNMAYNISVLQYTPESRWQWVRNGIRILRDEGIKYNPKSAALYKELTWIYWHKIGDILDDEHWNYKRALAVEMERVLGAPPVTLDDQGYMDWFREIVDAPRDLNLLLEEDSEVAALASELGALGLEPDESLLEFIARHIRPQIQVTDLLQEDREAQDPQFAARLALLTDEAPAAARERLVAAVRSDVLHNVMKFDLDWMFGLMEQYGPLDWRNAFAHALYWSSYGEFKSRGRAAVSRTNAINTARLTFFALQSLIDRGRIALEPNFDEPFKSYIDTSPDTRFIPYLYETYMRLGKEYFGDDPRFVEGTPGPNYMNGFVTAMHKWIQYLYFQGGDRNLEMAENYYSWLREHNPHPDGSTQSRYLQTLDAFVMGDLLSLLKSYRTASALIRNLINRGIKHFALNQKQAGLTSFARAKRCYEIWIKDADVARNERVKMQPLPTMLRDQILDQMQSPEFAALFKARLWKNLPLTMRQLVYDNLRPYFEELCAAQQPPWSVDAAFDEPPGMEEARKRELKSVGKVREEVDQGEGHKR